MMSREELVVNENFRSSGGDWAIWRRSLPRLFTGDERDEEKCSLPVLSLCSVHSP